MAASSAWNENKKMMHITKQIFLSNFYHVQIPNFFRQREFDNMDLHSAKFYYAKSTWCFKFTTYGDLTNDFSVFQVSLIKCDVEDQDTAIICTVSLLDRCGSIYNSLCNAAYFSGRVTELYIVEFSNSLYDNIESDTLSLRIQITSVAHSVNSKVPVSLTSDTVNRFPTRITQEDGSKISLTLLYTSQLSPFFTTITVPNFFTNKAYDDNEKESDTFEYADTTWKLQIIPSQESGECSFQVHLMKVFSSNFQIAIICQITVLSDQETMFESGSNAILFENEIVQRHVASFYNENEKWTDNLNLKLGIYLISDRALDITDRGILSLSRDFENMMFEGKDHNITFDVQGIKFQAHQDIVRSRSEVFSCMLTHNMSEKNNGLIDVQDIKPVIFEKLLRYVYTGRVLLDENNVFELFYAADKYHLSILKEQCREFIIVSLSVWNISKVIELALKHSDDLLLDSATRFFCINVDNILPTVEWQIFIAKNSTVANELIIKSLKFVRRHKD